MFDQAVATTKGTLMIVVNSVCGCAAGRARPGVALALVHDTKPARIATVFAGADVEATERARKYFTGNAAVITSVALLQNGHLVYMLHRHQIEMRSPRRSERNSRPPSTRSVRPNPRCDDPGEC